VKEYLGESYHRFENAVVSIVVRIKAVQQRGIAQSRAVAALYHDTVRRPQRSSAATCSVIVIGNSFDF
jgi:hypothetical protein